MLTLPVRVIETAGTPRGQRSAHHVHREPWTLQVLHQTPDTHLWLKCRGWRLEEHSSRVNIRLDLSLGCLLYRVNLSVRRLGARKRIPEYRNRGSYRRLCGPKLGTMAKIGGKEIIRQFLWIRLRLGLDLGTRVQTTSRCDNSGGDLMRVARDVSIHCRRLIPGLRLARRSSSSSRNRGGKMGRKRRRLRLCLWLWLQMWRLLGFSEEMVASPLEYIPNVEAYHSSQAATWSVVVVMVLTMMHV